MLGEEGNANCIIRVKSQQPHWTLFSVFIIRGILNLVEEADHLELPNVLYHVVWGCIEKLQTVPILVLSEDQLTKPTLVLAEVQRTKPKF